MYYVRRTPPHAINLEYLGAKRAAMHKELALWESYLGTNKFLVGAELTMADVAFFPSLAYNVRLGFNIARYPRLHAYYKHMCERPSVALSWPPHWKDSAGLPILSDTLPPGVGHTPSSSPVDDLVDSGDDDDASVDDDMM